jgi:hypothetical protein
VEIGHHTTGWCNLANIAFRSGAACSRAAARQIQPDLDLWQSLVADMDRLLEAHGLSFDDSQLQLSRPMEIDVAAERFVGDNADTANPFLRRQYRAGFEVTQIA